MYRSAKTRPQYLLRQLITSSLTAGSLLLMPLVGAAEDKVVSVDTTYTDTLGLAAADTLTVDDDVTATFNALPGIASAAADGTLLYPENSGIPWSYSSLPDFTNAVDYKGSAESPTVTNRGIMQFVPDFKLPASHVPVFEPRPWDISGENFFLVNKGTISTPYPGGGIRAYGDHFTFINDGSIDCGRKVVDLIGKEALLVNNSGATLSATNDRAVQVSALGAETPTLIENYGLITADSGTLLIFAPTIIINQGTISAKDSAGLIFNNGTNSSVTNRGEISAPDFPIILGSTSALSSNFSIKNEGSGKIESTSTESDNQHVAIWVEQVNNPTITNKDYANISGDVVFVYRTEDNINNSGEVSLLGGVLDGDIMFLDGRDTGDCGCIPSIFNNNYLQDEGFGEEGTAPVISKGGVNNNSQEAVVPSNHDADEVIANSPAAPGKLILDGGTIHGSVEMSSGSILSLSTPSGTSTNSITMNTGSQAYCISLQGSTAPLTVTDAQGKTVSVYPRQLMSAGTDNCHAMLVANSGLLDARYDKLSDKIINLDHKLQDGNTDWVFEVRYQDMRQDTDENQPHANSTILALSKLWHTTRGDWIFQASHDSTHIGQHLNNNSASIVLGHSQKWGKTSKLHMQLGGDRREMSMNLVGEQDTVTESSDYSVVYGEIGMGRVLHKFAGHDINMRMRLAAERIGSIGKGWDSDTISLMIPELSVSGRVLPSVLTDASHRLYGFLQKPMGDTTQKYTITGFSEDTYHYDTEVSGGIGYDLHAGVGANTMLHAKASYLNTGYLSLGLGISQNL